MDARDIKTNYKLEGFLYPSLLTEQLKLLIKYKEIEGLPDWPLMLDIKSNQVILKDYIARISEELAEAEEYIRRYNSELPGIAVGLLKGLMHEEIIDALHFYLDLIILVGSEKINFHIEYPHIVTEGAIEIPISVKKAMHEINYHLLIARNQLKNKPWKQTELPTNSTAFLENLEKAGIWFNILFYTIIGWNKQDIFANYMKKHEVNEFRQRSKY